MKLKLTVIVLLALALCTTSLAIFPCWSWSNTCGDTPACPNPIPDGTEWECFHMYCDQDLVCSWDANKKKMRTSTRIRHQWVEGTEVRECVEAPTYTDFSGYCCTCANPGTLYTNPN